MSFKGFFILIYSLILIGCIYGQEPQLLGGYKFIENKNQWPEQVHYRSDIQSGYLYLENDGFLFHLYDGKEFARYVQAHYDKSLPRNFDKLSWHSYKVTFNNCNTEAVAKGSLETPEYYNYFLGNDKSKWASHAKAFHRIEYKELYPGIDLHMYSKVFNLKYDFVVKANADANQIELNYEGADDIAIKNERLHIYTQVNHIIEDKPYAFQIIDGENIEVKCKFKLKGTTVTFAFPEGYNHNYDLIIDPTLMFATYSGSTANNFGYSATFDSKGFLYAGSSAFGAGYPTVLGSYDGTFNGGSGLSPGIDIAISKFDTTGTFLLYSTYIGGNSDELPHSLIVNNFDELFILGTTSSTNYPYTTGCYDSTYNGGVPNDLQQGLGANYINGSDIVASNLSSDGTTLLASTFIGGSGNDGLNSTHVFTSCSLNVLKYNYADEIRGEIDIDENNNIYIVSCTQSTDFPIVGNVFQPSFGGGDLDGVIIKLDNSLQNIIWSSYFGGEKHDAGYSLAIDSNEDIYITGGTNSDSLVTTPGVIDTNALGGRSDGFVAHIEAGGQQIISSTYYGSPTYDQSYFVELDNSNNVYLLGQTEIQDSTFIHNALYFNYGSGQFVSKITPELDSLIYSTVFGNGNGISLSPTAFLVDLCNKMYLSGWGGGTNNFNTCNNTSFTTGMPVTFDAFQGTTDGSDHYIMVLEDDVSNIIYGSFFGGPTSQEHVDGGTSRFDRKGKIYQAMCSGCGFNSDMPIYPANAVSPTNNSSCNLGVFKMDFDLPVVVADFETPPIGCAPYSYTFINTSLSQNYTSWGWDFGDGVGTSNQLNPSYTYTNAGTYTITLIVNDTATCNFGDTIQKDILIMGDTVYSLGDLSICPEESQQLGILPNSDPTITYSWFPTAGLSDSTISNPFAFPTSTTNYALLISNGVCTDTVFQNIIVNTPQLTISNDTTVCDDFSSVTFSANSFGTSTAYIWSSNNQFTDTLNSPITSNIITVSPSFTSTYFVQINNNGCYLNDSVILAVSGSSTTIIGDQGICIGDSIFLVVTNLNPSDTLTYDWSPDNSILSGDGTNTVWVNPSSTTTYSVTCTTTNGCVINNTVTVNVDNLPNLSADAWANNDTIFEGDFTQLNVTPNGYTYSWTPTESLNDANVQFPNASPTETTTYVVSINGNGCSKTDTVIVYVTEIICDEPYIFVPNAFTPDGDGINDILYVRGHPNSEIVFRVYDRWGELVFETFDINLGWDGIFKGKESDPAVFDYYLEVLCPGDETFFKKGNVTLIR
jgi:gliding motility-associated-like protein